MGGAAPMVFIVSKVGHFREGLRLRLKQVDSVHFLVKIANSGVKFPIGRAEVGSLMSENVPSRSARLKFTKLTVGVSKFV